MTTSALPLSNDARFQEAVSRARNDARPTTEGGHVGSEALRREVRAAIAWFKRMRDAWSPSRSIDDTQLERAPEGTDPVNDMCRARFEAVVTEASATQNAPPESGKSNEGERRTTAIEPANASPKGGVLAWLKRAWSQLTAGVRKSRLAMCVTPIAAYLALGGLVCMI